MQPGLVQPENCLMSDSADQESVVAPLDVRTEDICELSASLTGTDRPVKCREKSFDRLVELLDASGRDRRTGHCLR